MTAMEAEVAMTRFRQRYARSIKHMRIFGVLSLAWLLPLAAFANAAAYIAYAGNPLVSSDSWYFINAFLHKALEAGADFQDYFVKRDELDHAQPLVKLLLWLNARWLGLDYVFEAIIGLLFAIATFVLIARTTRKDGSLQPEWLRALILGVLATILVTLNSGMVFDWSLVTLIYVPYFFAVIGAAAAWHAVSSGRYIMLFPASLLIAFSFDGVGLIISVALIAAAMIAAAKLRNWKEGIVTAAVIVAAEASYFGAQRIFFDGLSGAESSSGVVTNLQLLWAHRSESLEIARIVFGSTLAHLNPINHYFPETAQSWQGVLAVLAVAAHIWFWWSAWKSRWNMPIFYAVAIMLIFYGLIAGILYARIPMYGIDYLHEPRYAGIYLLSNVSIVLMLLGQPLRMTKIRFRFAACTALLALLGLQIPLSMFTWHEGSFLYLYYHRMANDMLELGENPNVVPENCIPLLAVCRMSPAERIKAMEFLKRHELNIYSTAFAERYGLQKLVQFHTHKSE